MWKVITSAALQPFPEGEEEQVTKDTAAIMDSQYLEVH